MTGKAPGRQADVLGGTLESIDPKLREVLLAWALRQPSKYAGFLRMHGGLRAAARARRTAREAGLSVPPFFILSITSRCNLRCAGCYAASAGITGGEGALPLSEWQRIIDEACRLGVFGFILAGGEPFLYPGLLELVRAHRDRLFIIVTNGTALRDDDLLLLRRLANVMVVVSVEGGRELTDARRGEGVHARAMETLRRLGEAGVATGFSVTVSRLNRDHWMREREIDAMVDLGARMGVFIEYIPSPGARESPCSLDLATTTCPSMEALRELFASGGGSLVLGREERAAFRARMLDYRARKPLYIIHSPGDEELFGGCVSAGRGFAHITPAGDVTPCPVSCVATHNLGRSTLRGALASPLFERIRAAEGLLETGETPCALAAHPAEVEELAREVGAYKTGGMAGPRVGAVRRRLPAPSRA